MKIMGAVIDMTTISAKIKFHIPHAASLKDKRQACRSLVDRARRKFNASVAEVDTQDLHQTLTLGVAVVSGDGKHAQRMMDEIVRFMEDSTEADIISVE